MEKKCFCRVAGWTGALIACLFFLSRVGLAEATNFDFYSWPKENVANQWCFSLLPSSKEPVAAAEIKGAKDQICGRHDVKRLMGQVLPEGAKVYWKTNEAAGVVLPPRDLVNDLMRFSDTMDYKLMLPKGNPQDSRGDRWN
jgi:hypothetical protein